MLTNEQIEDLSKRMDFPLEGVYFKNELPKKLKFNTGYVINLQNSEDEDGNDNDGTHWTCLQVNKYPTGLIEPIFFDPYGAPPSEAIKKFVKDGCGKKLPYTEKDIQSLMNNACGFYVCALLHFINKFPQRKKDLYQDVSDFLELFEDLNKSHNYKKNEFILKHFFQSADPSKRKDIEVISGGIERISTENEDGVRIPVEVKTIG
jgi:hypothetical protein